MSRLATHASAHSRLIGSAAVGLLAGLSMPAAYSPTTRGLVAWNVAVWLYLLLLGWMMGHADHGRLRRVAVAQAESAATMLTLICLAAAVSLLGVVAELSAAKGPGAALAWPRLALALATVTGSWLLLPTTFALSYASAYYQSAQGPQGGQGGQAGGLQFPGADAGYKPDYGDFLYFAFTIAVAAQTADVSVTSPALRRVVLLQAVLSFAFNTAILAFGINLAAGLF